MESSLLIIKPWAQCRHQNTVRFMMRSDVLLVPNLIISTISKPRGSLAHHKWFCNQFPPFFPVLHLVNSGPVHSLMLSSHLFLCLPCLLLPFTVPCKMVLARPDEREIWPYHCSLHLFTVVRWSSCGPIACWATSAPAHCQTLDQLLMPTHW